MLFTCFLILHFGFTLGNFILKFEYLIRNQAGGVRSYPVRQHQTSEVWFVVPSIVFIFLLLGEMICEPSLLIIFPSQEEIFHPSDSSPFLVSSNNIFIIADAIHLKVGKRGLEQIFGICSHGVVTRVQAEHPGSEVREAYPSANNVSLFYYTWFVNEEIHCQS